MAAGPGSSTRLSSDRAEFCGEELLSWSLYRRPSILLPSSTRTVRAITEVEVFALGADDLKFVTSQFRKLHSKQLRHKFRPHSHQWRTWGVRFIQAAWFRYRRRKEAAALKERVRLAAVPRPEWCASLPPKASEFAAYAARLASSRRKMRSLTSGSVMEMMSALEKPAEPDFLCDEKSI